MSCFIIKQKEHLKSRDLMDRLSNNVLGFFLKLSKYFVGRTPYMNLFTKELCLKIQYVYEKLTFLPKIMKLFNTK